MKRLPPKLKRIKKRIDFIAFLKAYLRLNDLGHGFVESLKIMQLDKNAQVWIHELIFLLLQGDTVTSALPKLSHYFNEFDYNYLRLSLETNQLNHFANCYLQTDTDRTKIKSKIKEKSVYPLFLIGFSLILFVLLQSVFLPEYQELAKNLGYTQQMSGNLGSLLWMGLLLILLMAMVLHRFPKLKHHFFPISIEFEILSWAQSIDLGLKAKLPLIECLYLVDNHLKLNHLKSFTKTWILHLRLGYPMASAFQYAPDILFKELHNYRGDTDFFSKLSLKLQSKILYRLHQIEKCIQPTLFLLIGMICLYFFNKLYEPMFKMASF